VSPRLSALLTLLSDITYVSFLQQIFSFLHLKLSLQALVAHSKGREEEKVRKGMQVSLSGKLDKMYLSSIYFYQLNQTCICDFVLILVVDRRTNV